MLIGPADQPRIAGSNEKNCQIKFFAVFPRRRDATWSDAFGRITRPGGLFFPAKVPPYPLRRRAPARDDTRTFTEDRLGLVGCASSPSSARARSSRPRSRASVPASRRASSHVSLLFDFGNGYNNVRSREGAPRNARVAASAAFSSAPSPRRRAVADPTSTPRPLPRAVRTSPTRPLPSSRLVDVSRPRLSRQVIN